MKCLRLIAIALQCLGFAAGVVMLTPHGASADITCYDFDSIAEAQAVYDALPGDPYAIDSGWPPAGVGGGGDQEAGNGIPCDYTNGIPETSSPGDEAYKVFTDSSRNGLDQLPDREFEEAHVQDVQYAEAIQTVENPSKFYRIAGIATPEADIYADYEGHEVLGQCGSAATTARLKELLAPGTTIWFEIDDAAFGDQYTLARHIWIQLNGKIRLLSEVLVTEGRAVVATERPGTARADAKDNPPPTTRYRDALRKAQKLSMRAGSGIWIECKQ